MTSPLPTIEQELAAQANLLAQQTTAITGISQSLIYSRLKPMPVVRARWAIWYVLHSLNGWPCTTLGAHFAVNHATIIHGTRKAADLLRLDYAFQSLVQNLITPTTAQ